MANKEQDYAPQAKPADEVTKPCQEGIRVYPTRFALTDKAFKNIKSKGEMPPLPKNASGDENYDARRLRDGYVYILAVNAEVKGCFEISAEAANGQAWYIYRYRSKDVDFNQGNQAFGINYSFSLFNDYEAGYTNKVTLPTPYIELNKAIESAYMMFTDVDLPMSLLRKIETDPLVRNHWMRNVQLKNPQGYSINMATLQQTVKDFSPQTKMMTDQALTSNAYRFTPIGKPTGWEEIKNQLMHSQNGVIVALEDPVGTTRDLSGYHLYLTTERDNVLAKYEYAISTARILDAHALHKYKEAVKSARDSIEMANAELSGYGLPTVEPAPIKFSQLYQKVFSDSINSEHLKANGDADVLNVLKAELQLEDELPGVNAINKMAYIPTRFGTFFKNVVNAHSTFIETHSNKPSALYDLYAGNPEDVEAASAWCCYMHGFLHGLDISPYGRNALIAALPIEDADAYKAPPYAQQATPAVESLKKYLSDFTKALGALEKVAKTGYLNTATYDLVIELVIDKIYVRYANSSHRGYVGKPFSVPQTIRSTYQATLNTKEIEKILPTHRSQAAVPKHVKRLQENIRSLKVEYAPRQYGLFQITEGLAGLNKALSASVVLGFFVQNKAETELGKLGNDPFLASMQVIAGMYAPKGGLEQHTSRALTELEQLTSRKNLQQSKWISYFEQKGAGSALARIRNAIINVNTGLAGVGAMFEYFNWVEADYKSDEVGKTAALLSMGGGLAIEGAIGSLGMLAGSSLSAGTLTLLTGLSYATLGIGIVLITIAIIYNYFAPEDIELWAENGFWGKSEHYWGSPDQKKAYEWLGDRPENFDDQMSNSKFSYTNGLLDTTASVKFYRIEIQRYLKSVAEVVITLDTANPRKILIHYPGIYTEQDAKEIRIDRMEGYAKNVKKVYPSYEDWRLSIEKEKLHTTTKFEQEGVAGITIHDERLPYMNITTYSEDVDEGAIPYEDLLALSVQVSVPNYQGNKYRKKSKLTKLVLKKH
ncbi:MAG: toxin VasX [Aggregatibacter aphrophilus]|uniref:toxin VasX n=1 Tax=Aggregatibacter aphrophilus TaxID=732 RepID=UPI0029134089|nr:toxin VasX [Aggregatibacter aphrophilus]MDU7786567.1 toxin VasX [Aggregatibacter aphrophilus]